MLWVIIDYYDNVMLEHTDLRVHQIDYIQQPQRRQLQPHYNNYHLYKDIHLDEMMKILLRMSAILIHFFVNYLRLNLNFQEKYLFLFYFNLLIYFFKIVTGGLLFIENNIIIKLRKLKE